MLISFCGHVALQDSSGFDFIRQGEGERGREERETERERERKEEEMFSLAKGNESSQIVRIKIDDVFS